MIICTKWGLLFDIDKSKKQVEIWEKRTLEKDFWDNRQEAQATLKKISRVKEDIRRFEELLEKAYYIRDILEMAEKEGEQELFAETAKEIKSLREDFREFELLVLFSGEHDASNAIVSLHAGAGGTEAQDWVEMLLRMYTRWAEASNYEVEIMDYLAGEEAGIKSVTFLVKGAYAYAKLKCEEGVHRLIRISPFDSSGRRHTSFASLSVLPEIGEEIEININPDELKIDTFRAGGAGGQYVNKTESAVRITHIPTGIVAQCQNERSQHANRLAAMKILKAKLYELKQRETEDNLQKLKGEYKEISWGNQIRTYTLNPFTLVKDHRTNLEVGNVQAVLDGDIDDFIYAYLHKQSSHRFQNEQR